MSGNTKLWEHEAVDEIITEENRHTTISRLSARDGYRAVYAMVRYLAGEGIEAIGNHQQPVAVAAVNSWNMRHHEFTAWTDSIRANEFYTLLMKRYPRLYFGSLGDYDNLRVCKRCGDYETTNPDGICSRCRNQGWIYNHG